MRAMEIAGTANASRQSPASGEKERAMFAKKRQPAPAYQILIYVIDSNLWRWEIRSGVTLLRCGTAKTEADAHRFVTDEINA